MITLYHGSGAGDFEIHGDSLEEQEHESLLLNTRQILCARGADLAVDYLERAPFRVREGTNHFNDEFQVLLAYVPLQEYEEFRNLSEQPQAKSAFRQIAEVISEIGPSYIRFIAVDLKKISPESWDVFICHASEDKADVAEPLFRRLDSVGIRCWYDRGEILWGDSIVGKINEGLKCSRFVIVVVSRALLKTWPIKEMNAALSQEIDSGTTRVLPLMTGTDEEVQQMTNELPFQRDKKYIRWPGSPQEIERALRALIRRENARGKA